MTWPGNVWEWVADWYDANYYRLQPCTESTGASCSEIRAARRGGVRVNSELHLRAPTRTGDAPAYYSFYPGFRCAKTL